MSLSYSPVQIVVESVRRGPEGQLGAPASARLGPLRRTCDANVEVEDTPACSRINVGFSVAIDSAAIT